MVMFLKVLLYTVSILSAILLIAIIMIQQNKSGGGLGAVSGGTAENIFGTSAGNILTKITTWLAVIFLLSTLLLGTVIGRMNKKSVSETLLQDTTAAVVTPAETKPAEPKAEEKAAETPKAESAPVAVPAAAPKAEEKPAESAQAPAPKAEEKPADTQNK
ncbi:MAG: preprotein translocase subunit SecG [Victivallales bacterium]|nr:preprotein translocase subunit SecG [Victivallales bacterium]